MNATIYHNPRGSTSRQALEILRAAGIEPDVIDNLKRPPSKRRLQQGSRVRLCRPAERVRELI